MIIKTFALYFVFGPIVIFRIPISIGILIVEIFLLCMIYKNGTIRKLIDTERRRL